MITNLQSGTNVHEIADGIYRINTPIAIPGGPDEFNFNQYLIVDDAPLLFHTGPRKLFPLVREAMGRVMPVERLRYVAFSHFEADECGALNEWLAVAPRAETVCGQIAAMVSANDVGDRPARALADGELLSLGKHAVRWFDTPHLPHGWDCGLMMETSTRTFLCGDLFTQGGAGEITAYRIRHPRPERGVPRADGLLLARAGYHCDSRAPRARAADDARVHARQRLPRRRRGIAEGACAELERAAPIAGGGVGSASGCELPAW